MLIHLLAFGRNFKGCFEMRNYGVYRSVSGLGFLRIETPPTTSQYKKYLWIQNFATSTAFGRNYNGQLWLNNSTTDLGGWRGLKRGGVVRFVSSSSFGNTPAAENRFRRLRSKFSAATMSGFSVIRLSSATIAKLWCFWSIRMCRSEATVLRQIENLWS